MEVILRQAVDNLGHPGDIVDVSSGYARNFLLPRGIAYEATPGNKKRIAQEKERLEAAESARRDAASDSDFGTGWPASGPAVGAVTSFMLAGYRAAPARAKQCLLGRLGKLRLAPERQDRGASDLGQRQRRQLGPQ